MYYIATNKKEFSMVLHCGTYGCTHAVLHAVLPGLLICMLDARCVSLHLALLKFLAREMPAGNQLFTSTVLKDAVKR